ncbi:glycerophosphodiester phosphodiesterase 1 isoform X1 [Bos indicus x Bos taurus]|uniref:Glycerophosphodiester phosphodiesterase 1 n=2 Tax=Bos taurus TaxID=9913 RepID=A0AAA9RW64_BOVIN|nr:glycerophosphodiester phosphodiesterase 1 isoform X1 [Bos taurus]XP_019843722.1 PREDICTED: glycerophosphodiester phosphodiesterase 1 isoform X1 [Bos indicus]XP_027383030.1 glycerophosphodiester phosphodiesterase 1 isoform X1 [Bos indicus x Bos taurus]XP_061257259.1 glycerophosphodiester phosphodiesterase 1 isoform X1 [Bos javanicus]
MWLWEEQGGLMGPFSFLLLVLLLLTRSPFNACLFTGSLYLLLRLFSFEPVPSRRAMQVLKPRDRVSAIAHRGGSHDAPENTLAAIRQVLRMVMNKTEGVPAFTELGVGVGETGLKQAAKNGAAGVELDLEFTADGIPVLMHDSTVDRTTDGTGRLCDLTFEQIRKLNPAANHRLRNDFPNEKIPTLREAVAECLNHNLTIFFDVKGHAYKATDALKKVYMEFPKLYNNSIVCSFLPEVIYKMRQTDQNVVTALIHRPWSLSHTGDGKPRFESFWKQSMFVALDILLDWSMHNILWYLCGVSAFLAQKDFISPDYVKKWSAKGIQVVAWTVNTFDEKSYYESHLGSSYITDSMLEDCTPEF